MQAALRIRRGELARRLAAGPTIRREPERGLDDKLEGGDDEAGGPRPVANVAEDVGEARVFASEALAWVALQKRESGRTDRARAPHVLTAVVCGRGGGELQRARCKARYSKSPCVGVCTHVAKEREGIEGDAEVGCEDDEEAGDRKEDEHVAVALAQLARAGGRGHLRVCIGSTDRVRSRKGSARAAWYVRAGTA